MWQEKCLKREQTGKCEGRAAVQAAEEGHIKVEGQGWRKEDKDLKERQRETREGLTLLVTTHAEADTLTGHVRGTTITF